MQSAEESDELVEEIPLVVEGGSGVYVLQYPLRSLGRPYGAGDGMESQPSAVLWKKQHQCLELGFELRKSGTRNFDSDAVFKMDMLRLRSRGHPEQHAPVNLGVARIQQTSDSSSSGETRRVMIVSPVDGVLQMYPRFDHVDEWAQRESLLDIEPEDPSSSSIQDPTSSEPKRVLAKAKKIKNAEYSERPSWNRIQREFSRDPWLNLQQ